MQRQGKITYLGAKSPETDRYKILRVGCRPGPNDACQFLWRSVKGFWCGEGSNFGLFHWLASSPLKHSHFLLALIFVIAANLLRARVCVCVLTNVWLLLHDAAHWFSVSWPSSYGCINPGSCPQRSWQYVGDIWWIAEATDAPPL